MWSGSNKIGVCSNVVRTASKTIILAYVIAPYMSQIV